ncbi:DUF3021 domain-containing protein [Brevibacillus daliensis]|uniref:DUF3021 domain-containing protein n=1 Tax=Brevibacillus daliensis TaxID=2892995 RepID=UPI001E42C198|nr:DUF3021 domain-containing protein [Brevibacillus daliensis]
MFKLKHYLTTSCISFTLLILIFSILDIINVFPPITAYSVFQIFFMTSCITVLMYFTDKIPVKNNLMMIAIHLSDILFVVLTVGLLMNMFVLSKTNLLAICIIILLVYFGVYSVVMIKNHVDANYINKKIHSRKQQTGKGDTEHE